jgi:hypothetical protein
MPNHYHLLVETPQANLSRGLGWLQTTYSVRFNRRHQRCGHLFQGRFKAHLGEADSYAKALLRYLHLNPVRPRDKSAPVPRERREALEQYRWSSHRAYLGREAAPAWLCTEWLSFFGQNPKSARREYGRFVVAAFGHVVESPWEGLRLGLVLGGEELLARVRALVKAKPKSDELRWMAHAESGGKRRAAARALAEREKERPLQIWIRVQLGGERRVDVARAYGYKDGSAITHLLKRLAANEAVRRRLTALEAEHVNRASSFKS